MNYDWVGKKLGTSGTNTWGLIPGETNRPQVRILAVESSICIKEGNTKE